MATQKLTSAQGQEIVGLKYLVGTLDECMAIASANGFLGEAPVKRVDETKFQNNLWSKSNITYVCENGQYMYAVLNVMAEWVKVETNIGIAFQEKNTGIISLVAPKQATPKTKSEIFKAAWALAREGAARFGGSAKLYFSESLKIAYLESK